MPFAVEGLVHDAARAWLESRGFALVGEILSGANGVRRYPGGIVRLAWRLMRSGEIAVVSGGWIVNAPDPVRRSGKSPTHGKLPVSGE